MQDNVHRWIAKLIAVLVALVATASLAQAQDQLIPGAPSGAGAQTGGGSSTMGELPPVTVSSTYRLSPYDVIDMSVYGEEDLHTRARLGSDGTVLLPLIGSLNLSGMTVAEANDIIQKKYGSGLIKDPHILLSVIEYRKNTFSILGQVNRPGIYEIPEGSHLTIVDAILLAGGFTRIADQNHVKVRRLIHGKPNVTSVKAGAMADTSEVAPYEIAPGDIITVHESWW